MTVCKPSTSGDCLPFLYYLTFPVPIRLSGLTMDCKKTENHPVSPERKYGRFRVSSHRSGFRVSGFSDQTPRVRDRICTMEGPKPLTNKETPVLNTKLLNHKKGHHGRLTRDGFYPLRATQKGHTSSSGHPSCLLRRLQYRGKRTFVPTDLSSVTESYQGSWKSWKKGLCETDIVQ